VRFKKISLDAYINTCKSFGRDCSDEQFKDEWENIKLPQRTSYGTAGYDLSLPYEVDITANNPIIICTGVCFESERKDVCLMVLPRSSMGIKYGLRFLNTVPLIDVDGVQGFLEGQILLYVATDKDCILNKGEQFAQAVILPYFITEDDDVEIKENKVLFNEHGYNPWKRE